MTYRFGPFRADRIGYRVFEGDRALELTPKLLDLLFYLLERPATLVTKEELLEQVWPGANVTDNALAQAISDLRDALDDSPSAPTYIRTVARRGYRFVAPVEAEADLGSRRDSDDVARQDPESFPEGPRLPRSRPSPCSTSRTSPAIPTSRGSAPASPRRSRAISPRSITSASSIAGASCRRAGGRPAACTTSRRPSAPA